MTGELTLSLVEDCKAILTEGVFNSRWELIICYHKLGERINSEKLEGVYGQKTVSHLAQSLNTSRRTLYRACQFAEKYPDVNLLPDGKNISWSKIITNLLPETVSAPKEKRCPTCGRKY